jgi:hypothetical protein
LAKALGRVPKKGEFHENEEYVISSAIGHVVELFMPEDIDEKKYRFWRLEHLPIIPEKFELKPIVASKDRFALLKKLIARKDIGLVINACDAGREGELIFQTSCQLAKNKHPVKRLWLSSMTMEGIRKAFASLRDGAEMQGLADAARCRSEADWLVGINGTRALTKRMFGSRAGNVASGGRVQTPTLAILYARELEIRNFKPRGYWRVTAKFSIAAGEYEGTYQRPDFKKGDDEHDRIDRLWNKAAAEAVAAACAGKPVASVTEERKAGTQISPRLYDLTTLQREANGRYGFPAKRTLQIAQALYESHKMITYPRTDSRALPEDYMPVVREALRISRVDSSCTRSACSTTAGCSSTCIFNNAQAPTTSRSSDGQRGEAFRRVRAKISRHRAALRGGVPPGRGVRHDDAWHRRSPTKTEARSSHSRAGSRSTGKRCSTTTRQTPARCPRFRRRTRTQPQRSQRSSTRKRPNRRRATPRRRCSPRWKAPASSWRTRTSPRR